MLNCNQWSTVRAAMNVQKKLEMLSDQMATFYSAFNRRNYSTRSQTQKHITQRHTYLPRELQL